MASLFVRKARSFFRQPLVQQLWFVPAWLLLGASRLAILIFSFQKLAPRLGVHIGTVVYVPILSKRNESTAVRLSRAIQMAARYTPWESNCFPQAIAARLMLGLYKVPYALFFGVARDGKSADLKAHAWVVAGRVRVSGGYSFDRFTVVGGFVAPQLSSVLAAASDSTD